MALIKCRCKKYEKNFKKLEPKDLPDGWECEECPELMKEESEPKKEEKKEELKSEGKEAPKQEEKKEEKSSRRRKKRD